MKHATSRTLFSYWDALRGERAAPERGEIEPGDIRQILADTFILEIGPDRRTDFRLGGTRLCALFGRELKGEPLHGLWPKDAEAEVKPFIDVVVEDVTGVVVGLAGSTAGGALVDLEMLLLPLRHCGKTHARILGALSPAQIPLWIGYDAITRVETISMRVLRSSPRLAVLAKSQERSENRRRFVVHQGGRL